MSYVYILISEKNGRYYIGCTNDINLRLKTHNAGKVFSTKHFCPWKLIYHETYKTLSEARKRESQIKSWKKRSAIEKLIHAAVFVADAE